ncbi:hypothetical protein [Roseibacillus persicicus]|uniref:Uncharacterized protein n=1 Tax=Roseibacillus persicicus TaxID=454148 RepID=A0A918TJY9_9BACT|nr:hypothetical protein [Roseibacillus persicicus]GHC51612.1 hypothetical protein GCM10007100_17310 [Roseibacillus persicicus]
MVSNPEKEIRFTRSAQALRFALAGAIFVGLTATLYATARWGTGSPVRYWHMIPGILLAAGSFWLAYRCAKHAFLILSPVGVEFFPFFKPATNFRLWSWSEFHHAEVVGKRLYLHFNEEETGGAVLSLAPMSEESIRLLDVAIEGRMEERFQDGD